MHLKPRGLFWVVGLVLSMVAGPHAMANDPAEQSTAPGADKSVTVFPVVIKPELPAMKRKDGTAVSFGERMAMVLGVALERAGIGDVQLAETKFQPPAADDELQQIASAFAKRIAGDPIQTEYALYGEIHGTPKTGPERIYTILVDRQGKVVLADCDDPESYTETSDIPPKCPMTCTIFLARKVKRVWGLADPLRTDAPRGKLAARLEKQSGLPPREELAAIARRMEAMKDRVRTSKVVVYPVKVGSATDRQLAAKLVQMLNGRGFCRSTVAEVDPGLEIQGDPNEQKVLWDTARAFRKFLKQNPPKADYALFADYGVGRSQSGKTTVGYVHVIVCNRAGEWVAVDFQNSHHEDFQAIRPDSIEDCNRLVLKRAERLLSE